MVGLWLAIWFGVFVWSAVSPHDYFTWALEVAPAVLGLLNRTIEESRRAGKPVSVCGEMAGDVAFTELLLAMGLRSFSMHPARIAAVKQRVLRADTRMLSPKLRAALESDDPAQAWALHAAHG